MRRILLVLMAFAMMALMMGASIVPAVAAPGGGAIQSPHQCVEFSAEEGFCFHEVETPSGVINTQFQIEREKSAGGGGAEQGGTFVPGETVAHQADTPSGNSNVNIHNQPNPS